LNPSNITALLALTGKADNSPDRMPNASEGELTVLSYVSTTLVLNPAHWPSLVLPTT